MYHNLIQLYHRESANNTYSECKVIPNDIVYSNSQESHSLKIQQQDPENRLWSMCEIFSFISAAGARTSIFIQWWEVDVSYEAPTV